MTACPFSENSRGCVRSYHSPIEALFVPKRARVRRLIKFRFHVSCMNSKLVLSYCDSLERAADRNEESKQATRLENCERNTSGEREREKFEGNLNYLTSLRIFRFFDLVLFYFILFYFSVRYLYIFLKQEVWRFWWFFRKDYGCVLM